MAEKQQQTGGPGQPPAGGGQQTPTPKPPQGGSNPKLTEVDIFTSNAVSGAREIRGLGISIPCTNRKMTDEEIKVAIRQGFNVHLSNKPIKEAARLDINDKIVYE